MVDILIILYTWDRAELLEKSLSSMFENPGMNFRLFVLENGSINSNLYGSDSGLKQLNLLIDYYKQNKIDLLMLNKNNVGSYHAINQLMAVARCYSENPRIEYPDFVFATNDDMLYEPNWLSITYQAMLDLENTEHKVKIVSPFHCRNLKGEVVSGMNTITTKTVNGVTYEIKNNVSGNTWFMRWDTWVRLFDWYPTNSPNDNGDWQKLAILNAHNYKCAITPTELAHHMPEAQGNGKYNRAGHW